MTDYLEFKQKAIHAIEKEMESFIQLHVQDSQDLLSIYRYHLGLDADKKVRGKRIRPLMVSFSCFASGGEWEKAIPAACAVELLHNFSLIHDDIEDKSQLRHGRPTIWTKWGIAQAINAGDGMFALVFKAIQQFNETLKPEKVLAVQDVITDCCLRLIEGQFLDVENEGGKSISIIEYWKMIGGKTAALLGCCFQLGGLIAGLNEKYQADLYKFGFQLGLNYQVQDDLLGIWGSERITGKPSDNDLVNRKITLPVLLGMDMSERFIKWWNEGFTKNDEVKVISEWLKKDGVYQKMLQTIQEMDEEIERQFNSMKFLKKERLPVLRSLIDELRFRDK